ncbi:hypothetical protein FMN63_18630 [Stappia sp. BW2]|uniref:hypothetical protein n=1 Tax=Stappia sp. BW2 TaxID=2592622 RepID=UPI0011DEEB5D|nr:hypothetical protein [Stappia sp. BW2]TYC66366.1 hypothetical protein FMN63_18630 [Stappia sp. BW2]
MSRSDEEKCGRLMRTACANVIGFWQLLQEPDVLKIDHVKRLQYRAYMIGSALHLADLVVRHEHALIHLRKLAWEPELGEEARKFRTMVHAFRGDHLEAVDAKALVFSQAVQSAFAD